MRFRAVQRAGVALIETVAACATNAHESGDARGGGGAASAPDTKGGRPRARPAACVATA